MQIASTKRRGFALAVALAAIVIIAALITGIFFATTQDYRIGRNSALQTRALTAAEYGLNVVRSSGQWDPSWNTSANGVLAIRSYSPGDGGVDTVRVTKLNDGQFLVVSEGRAGIATGAQARHRVGTLVTLVVPQIKFLAALTTRGDAKIGGSSYIDGNDTTFAAFNCPPAVGGLPGLTLPDTSQVSTSGCKNFSCVAGSPKLSEDSLAGADDTYSQFGDLSYDDLAALAGHTVPGGGTLNGMKASVNGDGSCNTADPNNWGDPEHTTPSLAACQTYFPIIHATGDLHLSGGYGQGILLVDGNLQVTGGFEFYGAVIVRGTLNTTGQGGHFNGAVMAANVDLEQNTVLGDAVIHYSSCALNRALSASATPVRAKGRSWVELY